MSWAVSAKGTKEQVKAEAERQFDLAAAAYKNTEEGKDIAVARERAMSMLEELDLASGRSEDLPPMSASVYCYGSRSSWWEGAKSTSIGASFHVNVERIEPDSK